MPLGASITWGSKSSHGNGYREYLRELLMEGGYEVDMVGSRRAGSMNDNDVEGWPGARIDQVQRHAEDSVPDFVPNIFTLNAGGNDCMQGYSIDNMRSRMNDLLQDLWSMSPQSIIVLSTLTPNTDAAAEECARNTNMQYRDLSNSWQGKSRRIVIAEMRGVDGPKLADLADHVHPNDGGYAKMARVWFEAIKDARARGFLHDGEGSTSNTTR